MLFQKAWHMYYDKQNGGGFIHDSVLVVLFLIIIPIHSIWLKIVLAQFHVLSITSVNYTVFITMFML